MPRLWTETIETHRRTVHDAILDAAWALVTEHGLMAVSMSQIAAAAGIGRATLYKYFPDVGSVLSACHERHVREHLAQLSRLRDQRGDADSRLEAVLTTYALIAHHRGRQGTGELGALLHRGEHVARAEQHLLDLFHGLLEEVAATGRLREDVAPAELAAYCLHASSAAAALPSEAAVHRLVTVILDGLRPPP